MTHAATYDGARVVVLGAAGFIGQWVARALAARGAQLHLVARDASRLHRLTREMAPYAGTSVLDLGDADALRALVAAVRPAIVFNLAGYGVDPSERDASVARTLNEELPFRLAELLHEHGDRDWAGQQVVHAGSALEYGTASGDLRETTLCAPTTLYGVTKLAGTTRLHAAAAALGVRAVTGRLFTVYGAGEHAGRLLPSLLAAASTHEAIPLTAGLQQRDFTYVEDAADGLLRLGVLRGADLGPVNIATSRLSTVRAFVSIAAHELGIAPSRLGFGAVPTRAEEMHHDPVNIARLRALAGWSPSTKIADGVRRTAAWPRV